MVKERFRRNRVTGNWMMVVKNGGKTRLLPMFKGFNPRLRMIQNRIQMGMQLNRREKK
jgi:hypothetical protein